MTDEFKKAMSTQRYGASSAAGGGNIGSQLSTGVPKFIKYKFKTEDDFAKSKLNKNISFETGSFKPWLSKDIASKFIPTKMPKLNDNMNITYANRREHLHNWMKLILTMNENKGIFQYNGGIKITGTTVFPTDDDEFSTIGEISRNNYGGSGVKLYSLQTSIHNYDCAFHAFLQAISPLFRSLNEQAKNFVANEFRRDYILNVIVNEKGAPLKDFDTKEYWSDSESISIRDAYNGVEIINSKYVYFRDYLGGGGNKFTDFAPIELVGFNSKFFGYNYLAMSLLTTNEQNKGNEKKYEYVPINQIFGDINETIIVGNKYSVHFETICSNVDGVYKFIFNKNENFLKNFIVPELKLYDPANIEINGIKSKVLERKIMIFNNDNHIIIYLVTPINEQEEYNYKFNEYNFKNFLNSETLKGINELEKRKKNNKKMSNLCLIAVDNIKNASYLLIDYTKDKNKNKDKYKLLKLNENSVDLKFNPDDVKATHDLYEENGNLVLKKISKATVSVNEAELYNKNGWYNKNIDADKLPLPVLNADNMEETYQNRREHLTNWMIKILTTSKIMDFLICNQKQTSDENDLPIKNNVYLSPINAGTIRNLTFVDYYAFDYHNETTQADSKFLNPPKFGFEDKNQEFVDIKKYNFHQMNASSDDNSCGFFALLQAISPLYRALNSPAKLHITRIFRNSYVPQIIVNKNGAPMSTTAYKPAVMGGDAQTNELEMIRAEYNEYDSETSGRYNLIEYLNGTQNTQPTRASMHIINSRFFGYNMVSISKVKQSYTSGKYKFFKALVFKSVVKASCSSVKMPRSSLY